MKILPIAILTCLVLYCTGARAAKYQAVTTGFYTNSTTWGSIAPDSVITAGDTIVIPNGITVWMDTDIRVAHNSASLEIDGSLIDTFTGPMAYRMELTPCLFNGTGVLKQRRLSIKGGVTIDFEGDIFADRLECTGLIQHKSNTSIKIKDYLYLQDSTYRFDAGTLTLDSNATLVVIEGAFDVPAASTAIFDFSRPHTVQYSNVFSTSTGVELTHGIKYKNIELNTYGDVRLSEDLHLHGNFLAIRGKLDMNGYDITIEPTGDITGMFTYSWIVTGKRGVSSFIINSDSSITDVIKFSNYDTELKNLVINMGSRNAVAQLGGPVVISDTLSLQMGKVYLFIHDISISKNNTNSKGLIVGGSEDSYIITMDTVIGGYTHLGALNIRLYSGQSSLYPVGTFQHYTPVKVTNYSSLVEWIPIAAVDEVREYGNEGYNMSLSQPMINVSWATDFSLSSPGPDSMEFELMWKPVNEVNHFDRNSAYASITHKGSDKWSKENTTQANMNANGFYSLKRGLIHPRVGNDAHLYLSIFDNKTTVSITDIHNDHNTTFYPTPTKDELHFKGVEDNTEVRIYNSMGQLVTRQKLQQNTINVSMLPNDTYFLMLINIDTYKHFKFVKH